MFYDIFPNNNNSQQHNNQKERLCVNPKYIEVQYLVPKHFGTTETVHSNVVNITLRML